VARARKVCKAKQSNGTVLFFYFLYVRHFISGKEHELHQIKADTFFFTAEYYSKKEDRESSSCAVGQSIAQTFTNEKNLLRRFLGGVCVAILCVRRWCDAFGAVFVSRFFMCDAGVTLFERRSSVDFLCATLV
jgi:hypothetical protein